MLRKSETPQSATRYMTLNEVAAELGFKSRGSIYNLIYARELDAVSVGASGRGLRVTRASFEAYCARIEADAAKRFKAAS